MKLDLHVHTCHSGDSSNDVETIIDHLKERGFAGAAIIDHNSIAGGTEALGLKRSDFIVIPGVEVSSEKGHILALNVTTPIERGLSVAETINAIHRAGGIAVAAHPYRFWSGLGEENVKGMPFDAIEVQNGRSDARGNRRASKLAKVLQLPETGGSDSHESSSLGSAYTVVPDDCDSVEKVLQAVLKKRTTGEGQDRGAARTVHYVFKAVTEWIGRGMRRM